MRYKLTYEEFNEVRKHLEAAEDMLRKESLLLSTIINKAHYTMADVRAELEYAIQKKPKGDDD
jgi:hypothetical protein